MIDGIVRTFSINTPKRIKILFDGRGATKSSPSSGSSSRTTHKVTLWLILVATETKSVSGKFGFWIPRVINLQKFWPQKGTMCAPASFMVVTPSPHPLGCRITYYFFLLLQLKWLLVCISVIIIFGAYEVHTRVHAETSVSERTCCLAYKTILLSCQAA